MNKGLAKDVESDGRHAGPGTSTGWEGRRGCGRGGPGRPCVDATRTVCPEAATSRSPRGPRGNEDRAAQGADQAPAVGATSYGIQLKEEALQFPRARRMGPPGVGRAGASSAGRTGTHRLLEGWQRPAHDFPKGQDCVSFVAGWPPASWGATPNPRSVPAPPRGTLPDAPSAPPLRLPRASSRRTFSRAGALLAPVSGPFVVPPFLPSPGQSPNRVDATLQGASAGSMSADSPRPV